ncbi:MAG: hypothetical protein ABJB03_07575 [Rhodoglobus sp.]
MSTGAASPQKRLSGPAIALIVIGGVLVLAIVAVAFLLLGRGLGGNTPIADSTPTPTTSTAPVADGQGTDNSQDEADSTPRFTSFDAPTTVTCIQNQDKPEIMFAWTTENAVEVWYTSGPEDAKDDNYMQVPLNGNQNDLTDEHLFPCDHRQTSDYTITLVGPNGEHVSKYWVVTDLNWGVDQGSADN